MKNPNQESMRTMVAKDQVRRFDRYVEIQNALISTGKSLVVADSMEKAYERFKRLVEHAEGLWDDACFLLLRDRYATSLALSIVSIEEIGKIGVARFQLLGAAAERPNAARAPDVVARARKKHPFYSHHQKLLLAAGAGSLVNARLDRILGLARVVAFLDRVERGEIARLRLDCLYTDVDAAGQLVTAERVKKDEAEFFAVLAGELLAEVGGLVPVEFERLLARAIAFEKRINHPH